MELDSGNIPQEFFDYYHRLSSERRRSILEMRLDLTEALSVPTPGNGNKERETAAPRYQRKIMLSWMIPVIWQIMKR